MLMQDAADGLAAFDFATTSLDGTGQSADDGIGTTFAQHHAKGLARHPLQVRKQRAACGIRGEIEVHAPGRQHRLHLGRGEGLGQPLPRRLQQETRHVQRARQTLATQCFEHEICKCM
ncbi:MAG: hypothetical protein ACD_54C00938G0001 [uncultured bacterium]|nr:MAG: hypothetical protein ACD_54C00938G0001 [uncultured bacterium]